MNRGGGERLRYRLYGAWPKRFVAGMWDGTSDEKVIESMTLAYDYFEKI
jgi:hypothetical protein